MYRDHAFLFSVIYFQLSDVFSVNSAQKWSLKVIEHFLAEFKMVVQIVIGLRRVTY